LENQQEQEVKCGKGVRGTEKKSRGEERVTGIEHSENSKKGAI